MTGCRLIEESVVLTFSTYSWGKTFFWFCIFIYFIVKRKDICGKICMLLYKRKTDQYCLKWGNAIVLFLSLFVASIADQNKLDCCFFQSGIDQFPKNINKIETVNHKCVFYDLYAWYLGENININADLDLCIHFLIKLYVCVTSFCLFFFQLFIIGQKDKTFKSNTNTNKIFLCLLQIP